MLSYRARQCQLLVSIVVLFKVGFLNYMTVYCFHLTTVFEVVVLIAIAVFLIYVACGVTGHFKAVYLKRNQASLLKKQKAEQQATDTGDRVTDLAQ